MRHQNFGVNFSRQNFDASVFIITLLLGIVKNKLGQSL